MKRFCIPCILVLLFSCTNTIDKKINYQTAKEDFVTIKKEHPEYTTQDYDYAGDLLAGKMMGAVMQGSKDMSIDKTYKELLEEAKANRVKEQQDSIAYGNVMASFKKKIDVKCIKKEISTSDFGKSVTLTLTIINGSDKVLSGFSGKLNVQDMFKTDLMAANVKITDGLAPHKTKDTTFSYSLDFVSNTDALEVTPIEKLKFEWIPEELIYADGTDEKAPQKP